LTDDVDPPIMPAQDTGLAGDEVPTSGDHEADDSPETDPEIASAIERNSAGFSLWVSAWYFSQERFNSGLRSRQRYARYRDQLYGPFENEHGHVLDSYWCEEFPAASAVTHKESTRRWAPWRKKSDWTLHIVVNTPEGVEFDADATAALDLLGTAEIIATEVNDYLVGQSKYVVIDMTYGLVGDLLRILDAAARRLSHKEDGNSTSSSNGLLPPGLPGEGTQEPVRQSDPPHESKIVEDARHRSEWIQTYFRQCADRQGLFSFLRGLVISVLMIAAVGSVLIATTLSSPKRDEVFAVLIASALGACASVLQRMKAGGVGLDYRVGRQQLLILGAARPLLGVIAGLLLYLGVNAGIIPLALPLADDAKVALFAVVAFLAGFNERFVDDMLGDLGRRLSPRSGAAPDQEGQ
jgi:hypothetical protein